MTPKTRVRLDADLLMEIYELATAERATPGQIRLALVSRHGPDVPSLRTIQRAVHEMTTRDMSADWVALEADPHEAALVIPVLGMQLERHNRGGISISREHARLIAWVRTAVPDIPLDQAFEVARSIAVTSPQEQNERLLPFLGLAPWRDNGASYLEAYAHNGFRRLIGSWAEVAIEMRLAAERQKGDER